MAALDYLSYAADLLCVNPPHPTDFFDPGPTIRPGH